MYAVASGEYSYYRIHALFEDRALAEAHAAEVENDAYGTGFVEEYRVFDRLPQRRTWFSRYARLDDGVDLLHDDGELHERVGWEYDEDVVGLTPRPKLEIRYQPPWWAAEDDLRPGYYNLSARGLDAGAVNQAITDQIAQWRAQGYQLHNVAKPQPTTTMYVPYGA